MDNPENKTEKLVDMRANVEAHVESERAEHEPKKSALPLIPELTLVKGRLTTEPPEPRALLTYNEKPLLIRGVIGGLMATGGTGKSFFLLQLAYAMADGGNFGPLRAQEPLKVLVLAGEDPQEEVDRRLWKIGAGDFPDGLHVASVVGSNVGPLMHLDKNNPVTAPGWDWLRETIKSHEDLDVLVIDPKSRFYGLNENDNDHGTAWISCLESLSKEFSLTILFSHHVAKSKTEDMDQGMSRGASSIVDGCRWVAGLTSLNNKSAKRYGINKPRDYIEFDVTKTNYAAKLPSNFVFKRTETGVLKYAALEVKRLNCIMKMLYHALSKDTNKYSRRDLEKAENGCEHIFAAIESEVSSFQRTKEITLIIDRLIAGQLLVEKEEKPKKGKKKKRGPKKKVLESIPIDLMNFGQKRL